MINSSRSGNLRKEQLHFQSIATSRFIFFPGIKNWSSTRIYKYNDRSNSISKPSYSTSCFVSHPFPSAPGFAYIPPNPLSLNTRTATPTLPKTTNLDNGLGTSENERTSNKIQVKKVIGLRSVGVAVAVECDCMPEGNRLSFVSCCEDGTEGNDETAFED